MQVTYPTAGTWYTVVIKELLAVYLEPNSTDWQTTPR